ncbi:MAG: thioredoxin family protein [Acidimicrobiia bacterium]|nr:thioredoxin family protein [Acidimicrobiia bacterium]
MSVTLQYFNGCPNWKETEAHLEALRSEGFDLTFDRQLIETPEAAEQHGFRGSPTVLIDGVDPFADPDAPVGLSCRVYRLETGYGGSPSLDQLRTALRGTN